MRKGSKTYHWNIKKSNNQPGHRLRHAQGIQLRGLAIIEQSPIDNITGFIHNAERGMCLSVLLRAGVCIFRPPKELKWKRVQCSWERPQYVI